MQKIPVIAIFDVGKTNKKLLLFDEEYRIVYELSTQLEDGRDEDGFACEDIAALTSWIQREFEKISQDPRFDMKAVNFSAYGASFVYLDKEGKPFLPLYNYLKPYPAELQQKFYERYGGESQLAKQTASPVLGSLNSGMQLYRLKNEKPNEFARIQHALHLPQYLSYILSAQVNTDITSIGCHTGLWHFQWNAYHRWVKEEGLAPKFPPVKDGTELAGHTPEGIAVGVGLHDSSAALIPYLSSFTDPFVLLSTGTWSISLNPFNHSQLSDYELLEDCLCYLSYKGKPVKASRLFAGYEHEQQVKRLAAHFNTAVDYYKKVKPDPELIQAIMPRGMATRKTQEGTMIGQSRFGSRELNRFGNYEKAYHQLIADIMDQQIRSTNIVLKGTPVSRIFVDGGFGNNAIFMHMLAEAFPEIEVYAASVAQASAMGAALAIHHHWNTKGLPADIIELKLYSAIHASRL
ncbi:MAG TPA: FGGY family carbohydrate kinase [Chitinophagaceae bacterium]|nr:FGGY family carbohydrate kinase [Chitinophagaceae bacterium]